jgi:hypothetical protein
MPFSFIFLKVNLPLFFEVQNLQIMYAIPSLSPFTQFFYGYTPTYLIAFIGEPD